MSAILTLTQSIALTDLRAFLLNYLPSGIEVVQAQDNRVPEPTSPDFVLMTPVWRRALATNVDSAQDCTFTGTIDANAVMTVASIKGKITLKGIVFGLNFPLGGVPIQSQISGTPLGNGTYQLAKSQGTDPVVPTPEIDTPQLMAAGVNNITTDTHFTVQLDVHGPNSADNAQIINQLFWDSVAWDFFNGLNHGVFPLYADEARQMPFQNEEQQIEWRWVIAAEMQINPTVIVPQQFAAAITVTPVSVDVQYPP